ncbi:hypothetical protein R3P38DRAFT_3325580 [Favolaschia claudopus]|uniref:Nucleoprotein n=1 Tax=Favolaschia claudopus TaxID=2862362 RepID=A0AAW0AEI5_9AGAR
MNTPQFIFPAQAVPPQEVALGHGLGPFPPETPPISSPPLDPSTPQLVVSLLFIDNIARDFQLDAPQREQLLVCAQLGSVDGGLSKADLSSRLYYMGVFLWYMNERRREAERNSVDNITQLLEDLRVRLDEGYTFTREQTKNIRSVAQDVLYEPTRTSFMTMHLDVLQKLRGDQAPMKLAAVFGNHSREKVLVTMVKRTCSSVRNSYRQDIRNSICGDAPTSLADFTYTTAMKYMRGGPGLDLDVGYSVHNGLLRRFARENPAAIGVEEVEAEEDALDEPSSSPAPPSKKRKVSPSASGGGRIPKGKDFWSLVDAFFLRKIVEFGSKNLQSAGWNGYTKETLQLDKQFFPDDSQVETLSAGSGSLSAGSGGVNAQTTRMNGVTSLLNAL